MTIENEKYAFIEVVVDCGQLSWNYRLAGNSVIGHDNWDENVSNWSEEDILTLTYQMLSVDEDNRDVIEIRYV